MRYQNILKKSSVLGYCYYFAINILTFIRKIRSISHVKFNNIIVILALHKLGDSVFTIPSIREIKNSVDKPIYICCFEETGPIFELFFDEKVLIKFSHSDFLFKDRIARKKVYAEINKINPEMIIDLTGSIRTAAILLNAYAKEIIGINERFYRPLYDRYVPVRKTPHIMDIYLDVVKSFLPVKSDNIKEFPISLQTKGYILIQPFAGWAAKEWNLHKFISLGKRLSDKYDVVFVVPETPAVNPDLICEIKDFCKIVVSKTIKELIHWIRGCSIIISNDSGPIYIANSIGKPTFTIFGPTNPRFSTPFGEYHRYVQKVLKCSPPEDQQYCFTDAGREGCPSFECMNQLTVGEVYAQLEKFLIELEIETKKQING